MALADTARLIASLELQDKFTRTAANAEQAMDRLDRKSGLLGGSFGRIGDNLGQMGRGIGQVGTGFDKIITAGALAATAGLGAFITTAASFELSEAGIRKTVAGTIQEVDALIDSIKQMSRTVPLSFEELAAIAAEGGALGIATGSLANFTDIVARLGVSTDLSTEQATTALGHMSNVLHLTDDDLRDFADSLVALGNKGASTESEILDMATRFGAAGKQAGLTNEAILALASTTSSMGVEAEAGGGALSRIFQGITLDIGTATDESKVLAESMGLSLAELRTAWEHDAGTVFGDLLEIISKLDKFQQAEFLSNLGITNVRDINALSALSAGFEQYNTDLATATGQTNELNKESDAFFDTTAMKWEIFKNNVRLAADSIGGELLPIVNEVLGDLVKGLSDPATQASLKDFGESLAGGIREFIGEIKKADFGPLLDVLRTTADIARGAFDAFRQLPPGVQALALAAFGINKVTGGALGDIAKGFSNIFAGGIKIAFDQFMGRGSPTNPMFVVPVGGGLGGTPGTPGAPVNRGPAGGMGRFALGLTGVGIAALLAEEFSDEIQGLGADIHDSYLSWLPTSGLSARDLEWPFGPKNTPRILPEIFGGNGLLGGSGAFTPPRSGSADPNPQRPRDLPIERELLSTFAKLREGGIPAVLPDTAMRPITEGIAASSKNLGQAVERFEDGSSRALGKLPSLMREAIVQGSRQGSSDTSAKLREGGNPPDAGNFVETVQLDPSQVTDLREPTRLAFEELQKVKAELAAGNIARNIVRGTDESSLRIDRLNATMDLERAATAGYQAADAARIASLRDSQVAAAAAAAGYQAADAARIQGLRDSHNAALARLDTSNAHLANISAKNFAPIVKVDLVNSVSISATLLEQRLITARVAANGTPTTPGLL